MSENFDPYYKWLGIPPSEQPPNHYRLLGLNLFESDPDVIMNGSDRQMRHLRSFQAGPRVRECQQLLNEVAAAQVHLGDAQRKADYDQMLRASLVPPEPPPQADTVRSIPADTLPPTPFDLSASTATSPTSSSAAATSPVVVAKRAPRPRKQSMNIATIVVGGVILLFACGYGLRRTLRPHPRPIEPQAELAAEVGSLGTIASVEPDEPPTDPLPDGPVKPPASNIEAPPQPANAFVGALDEYHCTATSQPQLAIDNSFDPTKSWRLSMQVNASSHPDGSLLCWGDDRAGQDPICIKAGPDYITGWVMDTTRKDGTTNLPKMSITWPGWHDVELVHDAVAKVVQLRVDEECQNVAVSYPPRADRAMPVHLGGVGMPSLHAYPCHIRNLRLEQLTDPVNLLPPSAPDAVPEIDLAQQGESTEMREPNGSLGDLVNATEADKLAVPAASDLEAARAQVQRLFSNALSQDRSPQESAELADELQKQAVQSGTHPAMQYAMLTAAVDVAAKGGAVYSASRALQELDRSFSGDLTPLKAEAAEQIARVAKLAWEYKAVAELLEAVIDECLVADRYDLAVSLADRATDAARKSKDPSTIGRVVARSRDVKSLKAKYEPVRVALELLAGGSNDPLANETVGQYLCLVRGKWDEGLPYLVQGGASELRDVAARDIRNPTTSQTQAAVGSDWLKVAAQLERRLQFNAHLRAEYWCRLALAQETGVKRLSLEQQINDIGKEVGKLAELPPGAVLVMTFEPSTLKRQGYVLDVSQHGYVGVVYGNVALVKGIAGNAFAFDGMTGFIEVASTPWLSAPPALTLVAWVNAASWKDPNAAVDYVLSKDDWHVGSKGYVLRFRRGGFLNLTIAAPGWLDSVAETKVGLGTWHHIAAMSDGQVMRVFVDGEQCGGDSVAGAILPSDTPFRIGKSKFDQRRAFHGRIDEVAIFNRALSPDEVRTVYRIGRAGRPLME
ncbi:MAG TPA: LamG domain-containing protein [Pirellulaceae bacterium]|nr:LamG domain-containing protein [Pirellulaceae bacterium]